MSLARLRSTAFRFEEFGARKIAGKPATRCVFFVPSFEVTRTFSTGVPSVVPRTLEKAESVGSAQESEPAGATESRGEIYKPTQHSYFFSLGFLDNQIKSRRRATRDLIDVAPMLACRSGRAQKSLFFLFASIGAELHRLCDLFFKNNSLS